MKDVKKLAQFNPCQSALDFVVTCKSYKEAWETCPRGDWMLWIAKTVNVDIRTLTLAKALCAKTVIHLMKDQRSINAIKVAEDYGNGIGTNEDLKVAYAAADAAHAAAYADAYADAAAAYAAAAAAYADAAAAKQRNQLATANICRELLTKAVFVKVRLLK